MTKEEYIILFEKHLSGNTTPEEEELLLSYDDGFNIQDFHNDQRIDNQQHIHQKIFNKIENSRNKSVKRLAPSLWWAVAASVLLVISVGLFFLNKHEASESRYKSNNLVSSFKPIVPGGNKAILTLSNGSTINLNEVSNGIIEKNEQVAIKKEKNGQLVYSSDTGLPDKGDKISFNTISTPRGGQYQVILPDGTNVWLNAASSLRYPVKFTGAERHVELSGEAYFEVAKNKNMPFSINTNNVNIKVLGTHFNVMSYEDDSSVKTTLLEGSVLLSKLNQQALLVPGQQADVARSGEKINVTYVNTDDAVSWKNGYFTFRKESVVSIMKKVARWYDVEVEYQNDMSNVKLGGSISRGKNIKDLLNKIQLTGAVHFKIEGRRIIVRS
ncbi:FecR family protein [Mucilaginibacter sabulilitoris]|uniref:FecR family protein n=1 Tax=Mucilaginibacter sabulilitoris TaxID=1173583 RepID=A0ABZ0TI30_9SPHI|nr:FecR family protein [Mucilaginibacter sabulilitoris]WPU91235.1 FecR family protein [Mucilaginibacter sabulilitoris]